MQNEGILPNNQATRPQYLWFLTLTYTMVIVLANWFDPRLIHLFGLDTDAGTLIFPFTFLLSDLITEVYGYKFARQAIWCGFLFNAIFILYGQLVIHLPDPLYPTHNHVFDAMLAMNMRIIIASGISYLSAEPLNSFIMAKLKIKMRGRKMGVRFLLSTLVASCLDSFIFGMVAFYGMIANHDLLSLILTMWLIKVVIEFLGLPLAIKLANRLKKEEQMDIYDKSTEFSLFSLKTGYTNQENEFSQ